MQSGLPAETREMVDVLIVGGSVAGLSAAMLLGRCRRTVIICDAGKPRNRASNHMHGFLSREGMAPHEFLQTSRDQMSAFSNVSLRRGTVLRLRQTREGFLASLDDGTEIASRMILLATGIKDELPEIPGVEEFYGKSVHHCPYCDGWEHRDQAIAVYGEGKAGLALAEEMLIWSSQVTFCSSTLSASEREKLSALGVAISENAIIELEGTEGKLSALWMSDGSRLPCDALFFAGPQRQNCDLARQLGCRLDEGDFVACEKGNETCIAGVYSAGNTTSGLQLAIVAAAEGANAAHQINTALMERR